MPRGHRMDQCAVASRGEARLLRCSVCIGARDGVRSAHIGMGERSVSAKGDDELRVAVDLESSEEAQVTIRACVTERITFATHQNSVPIIRELAVCNGTDQRLENLVLELSASPTFFKPRAWSIDRIDPKGVAHVRDTDLQFDARMLYELTEAILGSVGFRLTSAGQVLVELAVPVRLLARNELGGVGSMPELLAAFVLP